MTGIDFTEYRRELLELHRKTIEAHWAKDIDFLVSDVAEGFMSVNNGEIAYPSLDEMRKNFTEYLQSTEFSVYRDLCEPLVGFSDDGSVAWVTVQVRVEGKTRNDGVQRELGFTCAWITLYRRKEGRWLRFCEVSSFR